MEFNFGSFQQTSMFGGAEEIAANLVAAEKKKEERKASSEKKKEAKKASSSKKKAVKVNCPVNVYTPYGMYTADAAEGFQLETEMEQLVDWMIAKGFEILKSQQVELQLEGGNLYMVFDTAKAGNKRHIIQWGENGTATLTVGDGMFNAYYTRADFEADEVTLQDVREKFASENLGYEGCELTYDPLSNMAVVLGKNIPKVAHSEEDDAVTLVVQEDSYEELEDATLKELHGKFLETHKEYEPVKNRVGYMLKEGVYYPMVLGKCQGDKRFAVEGNTGIAAEKEQKYPAPVSVRTIFGAFEVGSEGEEFTENEVREYLKRNYTEFSSKRFSLDYVEGVNCFQAIVYSSQKGAIERRADLSVGSFYLEDGALKAFTLKEGLEIPSVILENILEFFRQDMRLEAMVQVWYHTEKGFFLVIPDVEVVHKTYIRCAMDNEEIRSLIMDDKATLVATVHSHNDFVARFSCVDDVDEQGPGLFCVLGNLDQQIPSISVRAAYNGSFHYLPYKRLFQTEREFVQFGVL